MNAPRSTSVSPERPERDREPLVLLAGNPNAGKTTLFNALSGSRARVGNYPGVTIDRRSSTARVGDGSVELVDLPGTYSLVSRSPEEQIAIDAVTGHRGRRPDAVIVVVDSTALSRNLYLAVQLIESGAPVVVALNMMDEAASMGLRVDAHALGAFLGVDVIPTVASRGEGLDALRAAVSRAIAAAPRDASETTKAPSAAPASVALRLELAPEVTADVEEAGALVPWAETEADRRFWGTWALLSLGEDQLEGIPDELRAGVERIRQRAADAGRQLDLELISSRYRLIDEAVARTTNQPETAHRPWTDRLDAVLTHPVAGVAIFLVVMLVLFQMLFSWSAPAIEGVNATVGLLQGWVRDLLPDGPFRALLVNGVLRGVGNVLVFVPQIALLFLLIGALEDSGYLARAAFVIDRVMSAVGLHGKAFVPLISGFACAVPAVMSTRTIENRKDRLVTMLALPLMSCSARLPVYVLIAATVFVGTDRVFFGLLSPGAVVLLAMYTLSVIATLVAATLLRRTVLRGERPPFMLELPPYRWPLVRNLVSTTWQRVRTFLIDAGTIILALSILVWAMLNFPKSDAITQQYDVERAAATATLTGKPLEERLTAIESAEGAAQRKQSIAGHLGRAMEPAIAPLGFDWRMGIGILAAFGAREAFVSTMGIVFGVGEADAKSEPLHVSLRAAKKPDGSALLPPLVGASLLVFFVLACQCMSTVAIVKRESGSWKWAAFLVTYMGVLAYMASLFVYQVGSWLGWGLG